MNTPMRFVSSMAPVITQYVELKRALGRRFEVEEYILQRLDRFLDTHGAMDLTAEVFDDWCVSMQHLSLNTRIKRQRGVYQLCLFRSRSEPQCFIPDPSQLPGPAPRSRPHIFTETDIARLLQLTDTWMANSQSPLHGEVARLAIVLLYSSGLRRGELARLTLGDVDPVERVLLIRKTKFYKSRYVPLSDDAAQEMDRYLRVRCQPDFPDRPDASLLLHNQGGLIGYTGAGLGNLLRTLIREAGIHTRAGKSPRVHDLRFTFAVHAMRRWYRAGVDVQSRLPALSRYMGHGSIASTQYYLAFIDDVAEDASSLFEEHCATVLASVTKQGGRE